MWQPVKPRDFRGALHLWWPNADVGKVTALIGGRDRIFRFHVGLSICCLACELVEAQSPFDRLRANELKRTALRIDPTFLTPDVLLSRSKRPSIPGGHNRLALAQVALLPAGVLIPSALSNAVISGLNTFTVGITRYHCSSPAFVHTHQTRCLHRNCKAQYPARG